VTGTLNGKYIIGLWMETMMGTGPHHSYMRKLGFGAIEWKHLYWSVGRIYDWDSEWKIWYWPVEGNCDRDSDWKIKYWRGLKL
jgi:hypothetical protein